MSWKDVLKEDSDYEKFGWTKRGSLTQSAIEFAKEGDDVYPKTFMKKWINDTANKLVRNNPNMNMKKITQELYDVTAQKLAEVMVANIKQLEGVDNQLIDWEEVTEEYGGVIGDALETAERRHRWDF
jgi:hypothetical protein